MYPMITIHRAKERQKIQIYIDVKNVQLRCLRSFVGNSCIKWPAFVYGVTKLENGASHLGLTLSLSFRECVLVFFEVGAVN